MIILYGRPFTASSAPMAVFEGLGVEYRFEEVEDRGSSDYRAVHPLGLVPAVRWEDGSVTTESAAIVLHALDRFDPEHRLHPPPGTPEGARFLEAMCFLAAQVYPTYQRRYQTFRVGPKEFWPTVHAYAERQQHEHWGILETWLDGQTWIAGAAMSAADIYLLMLVTWWPDVTGLCGRYPNIARMCRAAVGHDYIVRTFERHCKADEIAIIRASA